MTRGVRNTGATAQKTTHTNNIGSKGTLYNQLQILSWTVEERTKYEKCHCGKWGTFHIRTDNGNYFFLCGTHYKEY
ncbi:hypothetical protein [uncultured Mediterranean phage uvMED]|nr:hypothetical protein [uncultured Mediterranean phage uvMED]